LPEADRVEHETDDLPTRLCEAREALEDAERELERSRRTDDASSR
jgi:voltage-gated sodium channel